MSCYNKDLKRIPGSSKICRINIQGEVDASWGKRFGSVRLKTNHRRNQLPISTLIVRMRGQSDLNRLLEKIYYQKLSLLSVEFMDKQSALLRKGCGTFLSTRRS